MKKFLDEEFYKNSKELMKDFKGANPNIWGQNVLKLELRDQFILTNHEKFSAREVTYVKKKLASIGSGKRRPFKLFN